jgi:hypothetical protein
MRSPSASTNAFMNPRVSGIVRDRNKATIGKLPDTSGGALALGLAFAQATRARGGSVNMQ